MILNERETPKGVLVSVCDPDILGETFENGDVSLTVTEDFYGGNEVEQAAVLESLDRAAVGNLVGTQTVEFAIENGFVDEGNVLEIGDTLHAQFLRMG